MSNRDLVKVTYIDKARKIKDTKRFKGYTWEAAKDWVMHVPRNIAEECEKFKNSFDVEWPSDKTPTEVELMKEIGNLKLELEKLRGKEPEPEKKKGGRPKKEE